MSFEEWWNTKDYPASCKGNCKEAYEAGAEPREKRIEELEVQIEKMKCCGNCKHYKKYCNGNDYCNLKDWEFTND